MGKKDRYISGSARPQETVGSGAQYQQKAHNTAADPFSGQSETKVPSGMTETSTIQSPSSNSQGSYGKGGFGNVNMRNPWLAGAVVVANGINTFSKVDTTPMQQGAKDMITNAIGMIPG